MAVPWTLYPVQEMDREETANVANQWGKCLCWTSFPFLDSFWISHLWTVFSSNLRQVKTDTDCCICLYLDVCLQSFPILKAQLLLPDEFLSSLPWPWRILCAYKEFKGWQLQCFRFWRVNIIWTSLISWVCVAGLEMLPKQVLHPPCLT